MTETSTLHQQELQNFSKCTLKRIAAYYPRIHSPVWFARAKWTESQNLLFPMIRRGPSEKEGNSRTWWTETLPRENKQSLHRDEARGTIRGLLLQRFPPPLYGCGYWIRSVPAASGLDGRNWKTSVFYFAQSLFYLQAFLALDEASITNVRGLLYCIPGLQTLEW